MSGTYDEEKKRYMREYYAKHRERIKARVTEHYEKTRPAQIDYRKKYYRDNKETMLANMAEYRQANKGNPEFISSRRQANAKHKAALRSAALAAYGNKCACCGEVIEEFLAIDHIHNDGSTHRKELGSKNIYLWLKQNNYPQDRFQILCFNCNWAKAIFGQCPHEAERLRNQISIVEDEGTRAIAG